VTEVVAVPLDAIVAMRDEYRREMDCQIVHDSWHVTVSSQFVAPRGARVFSQCDNNKPIDSSLSSAG
jgi:hypothetical protein